MEKTMKATAAFRTLKLIGAIAAAGLATGCSSTSTLFGGSDFQISATEAGMRAYGDHISAIITNGKASADAADTPAYQLRREQTAQETERKFGWKPNMKPNGSVNPSLPTNRDPVQGS